MRDQIRGFIIVSIMVTLIMWLFFYTYQPDFLKNDDFVAPGESKRGTNTDKSDKYLSDRGRSNAFLIALIIGLSIGFLYFLWSYYYKKDKVFMCEKKGKKLSCKEQN